MTVEFFPPPAEMIGKVVADETYIHFSARLLLRDQGLVAAIEGALCYLPSEAEGRVNVLKVNSRTGRVSALEYADFDEAPFPVLCCSWSRRGSDDSRSWAFRSYRESLNPPILHRKELLVSEGYPRRGEWAALTRTAEDLGLFEDPSTIGFRLNWEGLLASKGLRIVDGSIHPIGNESAPAIALESTEDKIQRHLTALSRTAISTPTQLLLRHGLLTARVTFFDYGCGRGGDVAGLRKEGFSASGWDPHFAPDHAVVAADVVNLGFVINVIEDPVERIEAIRKAFALTGKVMSVGVMLYTPGTAGRQFADGYLTSRNTFQKYFSQSELKDYLELVLHQEAILVGPGIAFVFADKELEQRFIAGRYRSRGIAARLLTAKRAVARERRLEGNSRLLGPAERPPRVPATERRLEAARPTLDRLWQCVLDLGRLPEPSEVDNLEEVGTKIGSLSMAFRLLREGYDFKLLKTAALSRRDDLLVYLAMQNFSHRKRYRTLDSRIQRDIKVFFGDYSSAQTEGLRLLRSAADSGNVLRASQQAAQQGLGWLDGEHSLQLHVSLVDRLPAVLRAYVGCGLELYGELGDAQLVKIHIGSGKLTLMEFENFDQSPLPLLSRRVKVNVPRLDYDVFEYGSAEFPKPLLYWKSRYMHEDMDGFAEQASFDESLEAIGILDGSEYGPAAEAFFKRLTLQRRSVVGMSLVPSQDIPDMDSVCGVNFTYRDFIECGETQRLTGIANTPRNPATFNALCELATYLIDPLVDYFGPIRLTYGFCSPELGKHIRSGVAPRLDQHASCEVGRSGKPVCSRVGAACDFVVDDEDMREVTEWIVSNLPFDRIYYYGSDRPIHVSYGPDHSRAAYEMVRNGSGRYMPRPYLRR